MGYRIINYNNNLFDSKILTPSSLLDGIISVWEMNTVANDICPDEMNINNGIVTNCETTTGILDNATKIISEGASIDLGNNFPFGAGQNFTISLWVSVENNPNFANLPITNREGTPPNAGFMIFYENRTNLTDSNGIRRDNSYCLSIDTGPTYHTVTAGQDSAPQNPGEWHHIVFYRKDSTMGIICDNGLANEFTNAALSGSLLSNSNLKLFIDYSQTYHYYGNIDQVCVWNKILTPTEVTELYNNGAGFRFANWTGGTVNPPISDDYVIANQINNYEAWPQTTIDTLGNLFTVYRASSGNIHGYDGTGKLVIKKSIDNGVTWGEEIIIADEPNIDDRNAGILIFFNQGVETILISYNTYNSSLQTELFCKKATTSNPYVWSNKIPISQNIGSGYGRSNPILLSNGKILVPFNSIDDFLYIGESSDNGDTWTNYVVNDSYRQEMTIIECKTNNAYEGKIFGFVRSVGTPYQFFETISLDYGHTWSPLVVNTEVIPGYETPAELLRWDDNTILAVTSHVGKVAIYSSTDESNSWTFAGYSAFPNSLPNSYYPSIVKISPTLLGTSWCTNASSSNTYFTVCTYPLQQ